MKHVLPLTLLSMLLLPVAVGSQSGIPSTPILFIDPGGHTKAVRAIAFTADGQLISAGDDKVIRVWDTAARRTVRTIRGQVGEGPAGRISALALSPDGEYLAVGGSFPGGTMQESSAIRVYKFKTGRMWKLLLGHEDKVTALAFSRDGKQLASGGSNSDRTVRVWDFEQGKVLQVLRGYNDAVRSVAFSPDGRVVAAGSDDTFVWLHEAKTGKVLRSLDKHNYGQVYGVAFSPDGRYLASGGLDNRIFLWEMKSGEYGVKELGRLKAGVTSVAFSSDGTRLLAGGKEGYCAVFSVPAGRILSEYKHDDNVWAVAFSPDDFTAATAGGQNAEVALWDSLGSLKPGPTILVGQGRAVRAVGFARDGSSVAFGTTPAEPGSTPALERVISFDKKDGYRVTVGSGVKSPDEYLREFPKVGDLELKFNRAKGEGGLVADSSLLVFEHDKLLRTITRSAAEGYRHKSYTLTHDGQYIISGAEDGVLSMYDVKTGKKAVEYVGHTSDVLSVAVSPDGRYLVSGSSDQTVKVWDIRSGQTLLTAFVADDGEWVAWTPQGFYGSSSRGDHFIGWHVNRGVSDQPDFYNVEQFQNHFARPDVVGLYVAERQIDLAIEHANEARQGLGHNSEQSYGGDLIKGSLPPTIEVLSPDRRQFDSQTQTVTLKARVTSKTLPITTVRVLLNGFSRGTFKGNANNMKGYANDMKGNANDNEAGREMNLEMQITLEEGCNTLAIIAQNRESRSKPEVLKIGYGPAGACKDPAAGGEFIRKQVFNKPSPPEEAAPPPPAPSLFRRAVYMRGGDEPLAPRQEPPKLRVSSPTQQTLTVPDNSIVLKFELLPGSPPAEVVIKNNGKQVDKYTLSPDSLPQVEVEVVLRPGLNVLTLSGVNGNAASETFTYNVTYNVPTDPRPTLIFLGIGISTYKENITPRLQWADRDAEELGRLLCRQRDAADPHSYYKDVKAMIISNDDANRDNIIKGLNWMNSQVTSKDDVRILLISGHGVIAKESYFFLTKDQVNGEDPELNSVPWDTFWRNLHNKRSRALFLVDTCRAGAAIPKHFLVNEQWADEEGVVFLGSSPSTRQSVEDNILKHGVFTKFVLDALSGKADDTEESDHKIDFNELTYWVRRRVLAATGVLPVEHAPSELPFFNLSTYPRPDLSPQQRCPERFP